VIREAHGNLLQADVDALVNTVNTVGVMGKGIALQFKRAYPENFDTYEAACRNHEVVPGRVFVYRTGQMSRPHFILNFPTKTHWRAKSKIADIESGLRDLRRIILELEISSIAVPPLGCGNGGLSWLDVRPLIHQQLGDMPDVEVLVYPPEGAPDAYDMIVRTARPTMTTKRAALIVAFARYIEMSVRSMLSMDGKLSLIEAQKVGYFLQLAGWPLELKFAPSYYGPYCQQLNQFISDTEGHFFTGYGDGTGGSKATLEIHDDAIAEARDRVEDLPNFHSTLARFDALIEGFEFPYGIELLSTVHYVAQHTQGEVTVDSVIAGIDAWSTRKSSLFKPAQASIALEHLTRRQAV
jgi:O-acetyl-ADP-ribose deacetylase (regulator of RNase III)